MELKRRFIFHGHAVAIGGRIVRPDDVMLDPKCASALAVTGGRSSSSLKATRFGKYVRFASAETLAEGVFDQMKQVVALTHKRIREDELTSTTTVRAEINGLVVGVDGLLTVKRLRGTLVSKSPAAADAETGIKLGKDTAIDGVAVGEHKLIVELNNGLFQEFDTYSKLKRAAADSKFCEDHAGSLLTRATAVAGQPRGSGLIEARGTCHGTIVRSIRWRGKPYPGATIDEHTVHVPDFGRIYFGEILIRNDSRRLTMMRLELGSAAGGSGAAGDVEDNGGWAP
jgi:hypothetical protein